MFAELFVSLQLEIFINSKKPMIMRKLFLSFLLAILVPMMAEAEDMYAVYDDGAKTFTFYYDDESGDRNGESYYIMPDESGEPEWYKADWKEKVAKVVFASSFAKARPTNTSYWFSGFKNMTVIVGLEYLNTSKVTIMASMFSGCEALTTLNVSHFNTGNVTNMDGMFGGCKTLTTLNVSHFNTGKVTNMWGMFSSCSGLKSLDVSNFDMKKVENIRGMFTWCKGLTTIYCNDDWNTDDMISSGMFENCISLMGGSNTLYDSKKVDATMAHPDTKDNPGYFTCKEDKPEGDLTHDGKIDTADVVWLVAIMINNSSVSLEEGDLNHDGAVNVADVVKLITMIKR